MKLRHAALVCSSRKNADRFYEGILGLSKIKSFLLTKGLAEQIFDLARECQIVVYGNENFQVEVFIDKVTSGKKPSFLHLCLEVKDMEAFVGKCKAGGVEVNQVPKGDSLLTFAQDYDGNLFEIKAHTG